MTEAEFPLSEIAEYPVRGREATDARIMDIVDALAGDNEATGK